MNRRTASPPIVRKLRCAVYTRKSSEEGLEQEFNSLHAQRESCEAYIQSQRAEGWVLVPDDYDDGGYSGGTLERPALQRLLKDIEAGRVNVVVVYKIDRLSRSLMDFTRLVEVFDRHGVTFVSVTQSFNTTTSMGRLTLNVLLSFAQFEREITSERLRDKVAASKKKGMWMGGYPVLGYDVRDHKLVVNRQEAKLVRRIFERFVQLGSGHEVAEELRKEGITGKSWVSRRGKRWNAAPMSKTVVYRALHNRLYVGEIVHKDAVYPGEHEAIVPRALWVRAHAILADGAPARSNRTRAQTPALLKGLLFTPSAKPFTPTHTRKAGRLYRYYICPPNDELPVHRIAAGEIETAVVDQVRALVQTPELMARTWQKAREHDSEITTRAVREALLEFDRLWDELFPAEQARIVQLLVERIVVNADGLDIRLRTEGLTSLVSDLRKAVATESVSAECSVANATKSDRNRRAA